MNWINNLRRRADEGEGNARNARVADPDALRAALQAADPAQAGDAALALGHALAESLQTPREADGPWVWAGAVADAPDKSVALAWIDAVRADDALAHIALQARFAEVRLAAAQRIESVETLELIAQACRDKDRGVYRHCADRLRTLHDAQQRDARALDIAAQLASLLEQTPLSVSRLLELERALRALGDAARLPAAAREQLALANARVREEGEISRAAHALRAQALDVGAQCGADAWPGEAALAQLTARMQALLSQRQGVPAWVLEQSGTKDLDAVVASAQAALDFQSEQFRRAQGCEQWLAAAQADATLAVPEQWNSLPKPQSPAALLALEQRWAALQPPPAPAPIAAGTPARRQRGARPAPATSPGEGDGQGESDQAATQDPERLRALVEELENAVAEGHLGQADAVAARMRQEPAPRPGSRLDARVQRANARLGDLHGWAKWGAARKREDLLAAAAGLQPESTDVEELAVAIVSLRQQWKALDAQGPSTRAQWDAFDAAIEKAYVPVAAWRARQAQERGEARQAKENFLQTWEATVSAIDWAQADCTALEQQRTGMLAQWRALPAGGYRDERLARKRFDPLLAAFDRHLEGARRAETERRRQLVAAAQALVQSGDLPAAMRSAKELQAQWRAPPGAPHLPRRDEQKLWQAFRAACDAVFSRRDAQRAEQTAQRQQRAAEQDAQLEALAAVIQGADSTALRGAIATLRALAGAGGAPARKGVPERTDPHERRARAMLRQAQERLAELGQQAYRQRIEGMLQSGAGAVDADATASAAALAQLLVDLEITLGLPSPASDAEVRRRRQIEKLQTHFRTGDAAGSANAEDLFARYCKLAGGGPPAGDPRIGAIVEKLVATHAASARR